MLMSKSSKENLQHCKPRQARSIASPGKPEGFTPHGLCCGYVKVKKKLEIGQTLFLQDNQRTIRVRVVKDIRPDRTARRFISEML